MVTVECRNVSDAYDRLLRLIVERGEVEESRNGKVKTLTSPLVLQINSPEERVLKAEGRNENPCFHLFEALYFLAGRNDVEFVAKFNPRMAEFSDDGVTFNAMYGFRWRNHFGYDQIERAIDILRSNPSSRRVVITMWDPTNDLGSESLDVPCHQQIIPRIHDGQLNFLTTNRSNDLVWGLCGSNAVHLSLLQEYMAVSLGLRVGKWVSVSNNAHVYEHHWKLYSKDRANPHHRWLPYPVERTIEDAPAFLQDCVDFCNGQVDDFRTPFFDGTVAPAIQGWLKLQGGDEDGAKYDFSCVESNNWRPVMLKWLKRKQK